MTDLRPSSSGPNAPQSKIDLSPSLGLRLGQDGSILDVVPGKAAFKVGIGPGMKVLAINSRRWSSEVLEEELAAARKPGESLELLIENGDILRTYKVDYHDGARHARLERIADKPDLLTQILKPQTSAD